MLFGKHINRYYRKHFFVLLLGLAALIMVVSIGVQYGTDGGVKIGSVAFSGLALAAIVGIFLNAILPDQLGMKVKSFNGKEKKYRK